MTEADVQTPLDVYRELKADGYDVEYVRLPITDEKAPKDSDFELFVKRLWNVPPTTALIFNCQMGRGRTTTGMIIGCLVLLRRMGAFPPPLARGPSDAVEFSQDGGAAAPALPPTPVETGLPPVPAWFSLAAEGAPAPADRLRAGLFGVVRSLLRVLESGNLGKAVLDEVVDAASAMQNLREAISQYRGRVLAEQKERRRATMMAVCLEYLERYYMLICFSSYLCWSKFDPNSKSHIVSSLLFGFSQLLARCRESLTAPQSLSKPSKPNPNPPPQNQPSLTPQPPPALPGLDRLAPRAPLRPLPHAAPQPHGGAGDARPRGHAAAGDAAARAGRRGQRVADAGGELRVQSRVWGVEVAGWRWGQYKSPFRCISNRSRAASHLSPHAPPPIPPQ